MESEKLTEVTQETEDAAVEKTKSEKVTEQDSPSNEMEAEAIEIVTKDAVNEQITEETMSTPNVVIIESNVLITPAPVAIEHRANSDDFKAEPANNETAHDKSRSDIEIKQCEQSTPKTQNIEKPNDNSETATPSGLSMLAQYDSDSDPEHTTSHDADDSAPQSDSDSVVEVPVTASTNYRNRVVEIGSDSDSSSTDSDSDDGLTQLSKLRKDITKCIAVDDDDDDDEDYDATGNKQRKRQPPRVKGELLLDDLPPIQDLQITVPEEECTELGRVHSIVDQLVLVGVLPNSVLLDLETVLFLDKGKRVLGEVFDVLGQVADPLYCVRFNSNKQIQEKGIAIGDLVYVAPKTQYTQYVILSSLMKLRGSDASWENDIEPPPRYIDYSDDEQEREARAQLRKKDRVPSESQNDDEVKRTRTETATATTSESRPNTQRRGRGGYERRGGGNQNGPQRYMQRAYAPHAAPAGYGPPPNYHAGSWHSAYRPTYRAPMPPPAYAMNAHMYGQPPMPPQAACFDVNMMPPNAGPPTMPPPGQMYYMNPYGMRPPVAMPMPCVVPPQEHPAGMYNAVVEPPPPPPGAS